MIAVMHLCQKFTIAINKIFLMTRYTYFKGVWKNSLLFLKIIKQRLKRNLFFETLLRL